MANTLEVEGKEILIKSSKGVMAVIPKHMASWVKSQIEAGKNDVVDRYVNSLEEYKYDSKKEQEAGNGLYANIHAKRARIAAGSGEHMRKTGEAGAPTADQFKQAAKTAKAEDGVVIIPNGDPPVNGSIAQASSTQVARPTAPRVIVNELSFLNNPAVQKKITPQDLYRNNNGRTLAQVLSNFIPIYEEGVDINDVVMGAASGDKERLNSGIIGMAAPLAGKAVLQGVDYATEKTLGKTRADYNAMKRNEIVNMTENERIELFKRYGFGGYDKWVADGKPKLTK